MPIEIHADDSRMRGAVMITNRNLTTYLASKQDNPKEKFAHLQDAMEGAVYLTDLRFNDDHTGGQMDLVSFSKNLEDVQIFTLKVNPAMQIQGMKEVFSLEKTSEATQEMAVDILSKLSNEGPNTSHDL